jgi:hypothetical protein
VGVDNMEHLGNERLMNYGQLRRDEIDMMAASTRPDKDGIPTSISDSLVLCHQNTSYQSKYIYY